MTFLFVATLIGGAVIFLYMRLIMGTYRELGL
jgi:hypothetical protein